ncbi:MAG: sporulation protein YqfD [Oscillospiraceae bacterium]
MARISDCLRGYAELKAVGAEPAKLLNACLELGVDFWNVYPEDAYTIYFNCRLKAAKAVQALENQSGCEIELLEKRGAPIFARRLRRRFVLWFLPLVLLIVLLVSSLFVWRIDIEGNEKVSDIEIMNALEDSGVYLGSFSLNYSSDLIRNQLLLKLPKLKWACVSVFGSRVQIKVREREEIPKLYIASEEKNIIAKQAGIIESIRALQGNPLFIKGQTAVRGDTLISGILPSVSGPTRIVHALGSVRARTWYEICAVMPMEYEEKVYTGAEKNRFALELGDNRINFYHNSGILEVNCDNIISEYSLGIEGLFQLPVSLVHIVSKSFETRRLSFTETEARAALESALNLRLAQSIGEDGEITSSEITFCVSKGRAIATLRAECKQNIAAEAPMSPEEINQATTKKEQINQ